MLKILSLTILLLVSCRGLLCADVFTIISNDNFETGVNKEIIIRPPATTSAYNGTVVLEGAELLSITQNDPKKTIDVNENKFLVFGLNDFAIEGDTIFTILPINHSVDVVITTEATTGQAVEVFTDDIVLSLVNNLDVNGDGVVNNDDILYAIPAVHNGTMHVTEFQEIVNVAKDNVG